MTKLEKIVYATDIVCFFVLGLVISQLILKEENEMFQGIGDLLGNNPFVIAIVVILAAGVSVGTMWIGVRSAARGQPMVALLLVKLFIFALPAIAASYVVAMALGWLRLYEMPLSSFAFLAVGATLYLCGGIAGIAAMNVTPEYKQVLRVWNKDRAAAAGQPLNEPGSRQ